MIKAIQIINFQSHVLSFLKFDPGVNIIIGSSDSGKSSIIRALNWTINNKPSGEAFKSTWANEGEINVSIRIISDNSDFNSNNISLIKRVKSDKNNLYVHENIKNNYTMEYKAFGQNVPDNISKEINFSDLNIQYQMDSPFLLSDSNGEVAKQLNKIVHLDVIDKAQTNIESKKRKHKREIEYLKQELEVINKDLEEYDDLEELEKKIIYLEQLQKVLEVKETQLTSLRKLIIQIKRNEKIKEEMEEYISKLPQVEKIIKLNKEMSNLENKRLELDSLVYKIKSKIKEKEFWNEIIKKEQENYNNIFPKNSCPFCGRDIKQ